MASQANKRPMAVYIGRFSLFHNGHAAVLLRALKAYDTVVVIVGSDRTPRTIKNPWTAAERADLILSWYEAQQKRRSGALGTLILETNRDFPYNNDLWLAEVQRIIADSTHPNLNGPIYITGAKRDDTGFYLDMFPSPTYELDLVDEDTSVSKFLTATWCREIYLARSFNGTALNDREYDLMLRAFVPEETMKFLSEFQRKNSLIADPSLPMDLHLAEVAARDMPKYLGVAPAFDYLLHEHKVTTARRAEIAGKYEPVTLTADAVVIQSGHVLLIKRRHAPGQGLWALPGGYVNRREWTTEASVRELLEESSIKAAPQAIRGSIVADHWFEHPDRSNINRVITHAFCFKLPDNKVNGRPTLSKVKAADDAISARWFPLAEALDMSDVLFDDHHSILEHFVNVLTTKGQTS